MEERRMKHYTNFDSLFTLMIIIIVILVSFIAGVQCGKWDERHRSNIDAYMEEK
jgi:hypothetical protein